MRVPWRLGLVAIIATAVVAGFVPHGTLTAAERSPAEVVQAVETPVSVPVLCLDATCGKGSPTPSAPTPGVALAAMLAGLVAAAAVGAAARRRRHQAVLLPAGAIETLDRPPQFS